MTLRLGVGLPQVFGSRPVRPDEIVAVAKLSEQMGFDSVWVQEDLLGRSGTLDPLVVLSYVAAHTDQVSLGVAVLLAPVLDPVQLAKTTASLDQLSGGRLILGLGLGDNGQEYPAHGLDPDGRSLRFEQVVDTLTSLWTGDPVQLAGSPFDIAQVQMFPRPVQRPTPPLWFGGYADAALARAARWGTGYVGGGAQTVAEFKDAVGRLREHLGKRPDFTVAKRVYLACTEHHAQARLRLEKWLTDYYGSEEKARSVALVGSKDELVEGLAELVACGAQELILNFVFEEELAVEAAAHEILPALRQTVASMYVGASGS